MWESIYLIPSEVRDLNEFRKVSCLSLRTRVFTVCHGNIINVLLLCLTGLRENRRHPATYLVHGAKALNNAFRSWTRKEVDKMFYVLLFYMSFFPLSIICFIT